MDVPVTVNIQLSDPARIQLTTTPVSMWGSTYNTTTTISSFDRDKSGLYTCTATFSSVFSFFRDSRPNSVALKVTTGQTIKKYAIILF